MEGELTPPISPVRGSDVSGSRTRNHGEGFVEQGERREQDVRSKEGRGIGDDDYEGGVGEVDRYTATRKERRARKVSELTIGVGNEYGYGYGHGHGGRTGLRTKLSGMSMKGTFGREEGDGDRLGVEGYGHTQRNRSELRDGDGSDDGSDMIGG